MGFHFFVSVNKRTDGLMLQHRKPWSPQLKCMGLEHNRDKLNHMELRQRCSDKDMARRVRVGFKNRFPQHFDGERS